ncbi:MAG TPA: HNH endonuclease [Desulfobacterales bacterium]|nr:HNH endonuclease [Desulfobacterales bacterium]
MDPLPSKTETNQFWEYFEFCCAYCGVSIERKSRTGYMDHLVPTSEGGSNNIHNHALSCARCNGDEKREKLWDTFLATKSQDVSTHKKCKEKIERWLSLAPSFLKNQEIVTETEEIIKEAIGNFEKSVNKMRVLREKSTYPKGQVTQNVINFAIQ